MLGPSQAMVHSLSVHMRLPTAAHFTCGLVEVVHHLGPLALHVRPLVSVDAEALRDLATPCRCSSARTARTPSSCSTSRTSSSGTCTRRPCSSRRRRASCPRAGTRFDSAALDPRPSPGSARVFGPGVGRNCHVTRRNTRVCCGCGCDGAQWRQVGGVLRSGGGLAAQATKAPITQDKGSAVQRMAAGSTSEPG